MPMWAAVAAVATSWISRVDAVVVTDDRAENAFQDFMKEYGRSYEIGSAEYSERWALFRQRIAEIEVQNADPKRLWTAGINRFTDWTEQERKKVRGYKPVNVGGASEQAVEGEAELTDRDRPESLDTMSWSNLSIANEIPDQGSCGSCWAVTTTSVLDAHHEIYIAKGKRFSPQELVSCVRNPQHCGGKGGCDGATVEMGMDYALKKGLTTLEETPYRASDLSCGAVKMPVLVSDKGGEISDDVGHHDGDGDDSGDDSEVAGHAFGLVAWEMLPRNKESPLIRALVERGPVAISVSAAKWFGYRSGIFDSCPKDIVVDHAVTLYGYGKEDGHMYWSIRNSWGKRWGESGYIRMLRRSDEDSHCGWDTDPQKGTGCDNGPSRVWVCGTCGILYDNVVPKFDKSKMSTKLYQHDAGRHGADESQRENVMPVLHEIGGASEEIANLDASLLRREV